MSNSPTRKSWGDRSVLGAMIRTQMRARRWYTVDDLLEHSHFSAVATRRQMVAALRDLKGLNLVESRGRRPMEYRKVGR